jgi:hypothetical protein
LETTEPCLETRAPASADDAEALLALVAAPRTAPVTWADGTTTELTFALEGPAPFFVSSRPNPRFTLDIAVECRDHLLLSGTGRLRTADGRLDESWAQAELRSTGNGEAVLVQSVGVDQLRGSYRPPTEASECFRAVQFELTLSPEGFSGSFVDTIAGAPCGAGAPSTPVSGRRGVTFTAPSP